jgi:UDP-glucose 4-epimerase
MPQSGILVTGGAGYIGSHVALMLSEAGEQVVVLDNLSTGFRDAVPDGTFVQGDVADRGLVSGLIRTYDIDTVMHFAAHTVVPESVADPLKYYGNNTCATRTLLECCRDTAVKHFVFSSSAQVYGICADGLIGEEAPTAPANPYGASKLMSEWMLRDLSAGSDLRHVTLRYFNVAGSDPKGRIGQSTRDATLLIKAACEVGLGKRPELTVFGTDYPTPDGTGVRDYIHVTDLAAAHVRALDHLRNGGPSGTYNAGYGHGFSVRQVVAAVERALGKKLPVREAPRRAGDPPSLIAMSGAIRRTLGWKPELDDLDIIVRTTLNWERRLKS